MSTEYRLTITDPQTSIDLLTFDIFLQDFPEAEAEGKEDEDATRASFRAALDLLNETAALIPAATIAYQTIIEDKTFPRSQYLRIQHSQAQEYLANLTNRWWHLLGILVGLSKGMHVFYRM